MADASNYARFLNPWVLHHQKLGLELKCPLCLNLLNRPTLLPCNHIFCDSCVPRLTQFGSECPVCKQQYSDRDARPAPYMENLVAIYRSLEATFSASLFQSLTSDAGRVPLQSPVSLKTNVDNQSKESVETPQEGNSSNGQCISSLTANKRVRASLNHSVEEGNKLTGKSDKSTLPTTSNVEKFQMRDAGKVVFHGGDKLVSPHYFGWARGATNEELVTPEIDINQVLQLSPVSPPSVDAKDVNDDSSDPGSRNDSTEKHPAKRSVENNSNDKAGGDRTSPSAGDHTRDVKRQKKLNYGLFDMGVKIDGCTQPNVAVSKLESKFENLSGAKASTISDLCDANKSICAFCQCSGLTDRTGPMLHYVNGKEVAGDAATNTSAIHVHKICIEWTPQAYFVGETVKNLKAEVARASKLKCSSCGLKGAALGCFVNSCRKSYHVPCAVEIIGCRWDFEDFLMLCPSHSSVKFPREKSKNGKHASEKQHFVPAETTLKQSNFWGASPNGVKKWVFCGSALSAEEKYLLVKFANICGATVSKFWKPNVTHVIAATDAKGACSRTLKVLKAILNGRWILKTDWIKACMEAMQPVDEEPYEVSLDNHGCCDGPRTGRLRVLNNVPKLFNGLNFYFTGDFIPGYKDDLLDLVITAGGTVIESKEQLVAQGQDTQTTSSGTLVVYNNDTMQGRRLEEEGSVVLQRLEVAERLGDEIGSQVIIAHTWLLESIAASKLQPFGC
ncbi:unnamed protein product [Camellia sinensis]